MNARAKAKRLRKQCGVRGRVDVVEVAHLLGLEVDYRTFTGTEIDEVIVGSCIAVADHLDEPSQRWAIAHAIGHHVMQAQSNAIWLRTYTLLPDKFELQAEDFAFHLLVDLEEARAEGLTDAAAIAEPLRGAAGDGAGTGGVREGKPLLPKEGWNDLDGS